MSVYRAKLGAERFSAVAWSMMAYMRSFAILSAFLFCREGAWRGVGAGGWDRRDRRACATN